MGGGIANGMIALSMVFTPAMCGSPRRRRLNQSLDFVEAARATGAGTLTILRHHILGNVLGPVFIYASSLVSVGILLASGLRSSVLACDRDRDWGLMLSTLRSRFMSPIICAMPGAAIFVTSIVFTSSAMDCARRWE